MLSLLLVSVIAGLCYGQNSNSHDFSDCATVQEIIANCATGHLGYLLNEVQYYNQMQSLQLITLPNILLPILDTICTEKMHLKEYYQCAFANVTTCLKSENSSQVMRLPDADRIAHGIVHMCDDRADLNKTCLGSAIDDVIGCYGKFISDNTYAKPCELFEGLIGCAEEPLSGCGGGGDVKDFLVSARFAHCPYTSAVAACLPSALLLLGMLLAHFIRLQ